MINGETRPGASPGDSPPAGEWMNVAAAAKRLGITPKAVRNRIDRGAIPWRAAGNQGREVLVPAERDGGPGDWPGPSPGDVALLVEIARLEERLAAETRRSSELQGRLDRLETSLELERSRADAALAAERSRGDRLAAELALARKGWLERLLEAVRRR
jgi:hypothetical protein